MKSKTLLLFSFLLIAVMQLSAQKKTVILSGIITDSKSKVAIPYANVVLKSSKDSKIFFGTVSGEDGRFTITGVNSGNFTLEVTSIGFKTKSQSVFVGSLSDYLDLGTIELEEDINTLSEVL